MTVQVRGRRSPATRARILDAARTRLLQDGFAKLSTRAVADEAGVPLSQVHYHLGTKAQLVLALLEEENTRRLARHTAMYAEVDRPVWQRYEQACDDFEDDLESGYVRVLQEMIAAGWSDPELAAQVRKQVQGWLDVLTETMREAEAKVGPLGPFTPDEAAALVGQAFMGGEAMLLLGFDRRQWPVRSALRRVGALIRRLEEGTG